MDYNKINERFYSQNYWTIDRSENKWFSKYVKVKIIDKWIRGINKGVLYDAGGGVGNYAAYFGKRFSKVIVSDISKIALSKIPEEYIEKLNCSILDNKLPDNYVDCIFLIDVFEHIDTKDLLKMMKDLKRILKPDGRIIIFTSHFGMGLGAVIQRISNPKKRLLGNEYKEGHVNRLKYKEFEKLFEEAELEIDNFYFYSIFFQQITDKIKDTFAIIVSRIKGWQNLDIALGRLGQKTKENFRKKETKIIFKVPLILLSWISYLDIVLFGKWFPGNSIFFSLKKKKHLHK
ncbi:MAG: class I SAM-dependent methyltransferase [Candidatus Pacearchaeota archaeon]